MNREARGSSGGGWKALAIFLAIVLVAAGILIGVFYALGDITFGKAEEQSEAKAANGGMVLAADEGSGAVVAMSAIAEEDFGDYGISESAESAELVTATLDPADATYTTANWSAAWANAESEWASGKTVTDYVTVTPTEDNDVSAVVACLQPFGEQAVVTLSVSGGSTVSATCTVDYAQKIDESSVSLFFGNTRILDAPYVLGDSYSLQFGIESSIEFEQYPSGGEMDASFSMSDTAYTLENECTLTVSLSSPVEGESALNDSIPYFYYKTGSPDPFYVFNNYEGGVAENGMYFSLAWFADNLGLALKDGGSHGYYAEYELFGEDAWGDVADYAELLNSLSEDIAMCVIDFSISGPYSSYEKHVTVYLNTTSYEYAANLVSVSLDEDSVVF